MRLDFECWAGLVCPGHTLPGSGPKTSATTSVWAAHLIRHSPAAGLKRCRDDLGDLPMNPGGITIPRLSQGILANTHAHTQSMSYSVGLQAPSLREGTSGSSAIWVGVQMLEYPGTQQMDANGLYVHNPNYWLMCLLGRDFRHCGYQQTPQPICRNKMERKWTAHDSIHIYIYYCNHLCKHVYI
jgi:hypothetical protein